MLPGAGVMARPARDAEHCSTIRLSGAGLLLGLLVALAAGALVSHLHQRALRQAEWSLQALSKVLGDQTERALDAVDLVQGSIIEVLGAEGDLSARDFAAVAGNRSVLQEIAARTAGVPQVREVLLIDSHGRLAGDTGAAPGGPGATSWQRYFDPFAADPTLQRLMSDPVRDPRSGRRVFYAARRITDSQGNFVGVLASAVDLAYFERTFADAALSPDYAAAISRRDGVLLAHYPAVNEVIGGRFPDPAALQRLAISGGDSVLRISTPGAGTDRIGAVHFLTRYPMVVSNSRLTSAVLLPWRQEAAVLIGGAVLMELGLVGLVMVGESRSRDRGRLQAAEVAREAALQLAAAERALREQHQRLGTALDTMSHGLCMFDDGNRMLVANRRLAELLGIAKPPAPGTTFAECLACLATSTVLRPSDARRVAARVRLLLAAGKSVAAAWELPDGPTLAVNFQPGSPGGWLVSCEDISAQQKAARRVAFLAHHDPLTALANRTLFLERLEQAVVQAVRGAACAVMCLDLDRFKEVNDTLGHAVGDALLQDVARRLRRCVRASDTVARLGGDEFAIIQPGLQQIGDAMALAQRVLDEVGLPYVLFGKTISVGVSIGIAIVPDDAADAETVLQHADMALYEGKRDSGGCFRFFDHALTSGLEARRALLAELAAALQADAFEVFYQPFVNPVAGRVIGFEALLRWHHPTRGLVPPDQFIPLAESVGLIVPIGEWVLRQACRLAASWPADVRLAVNLSPAQFRDHGLVAAVAAALDQSGLPPARLELELTESVLLNDTPETTAVIGQLRALGVALVMDDFGTGYSSLGYLHRFRFDKVKIDRSFIAALGQRREALAVVRAIVGICRQLEMATVAEGVETPEQLAVLRAEGCEEMQGYLFGRPCPGDTTAAVLLRGARPELPAQRLLARGG